MDTEFIYSDTPPNSALFSHSKYACGAYEKTSRENIVTEIVCSLCHFTLPILRWQEVGQD